MIFWLFGLAVLCFAFALKINWTWVVFGTDFAVYFFIAPLARKHAATSDTEPELPM
jgi:hypothetical protein